MTDTVAGLLQVVLLLAVLVAVYKPLGDYMARVYTAKTHLRAERRSAARPSSVLFLVQCVVDLFI